MNDEHETERERQRRARKAAQWHPETLCEIRIFCSAIGGTQCRAVEMLEGMIDELGMDFRPGQPWHQMLDLLRPLLWMPARRLDDPEFIKKFSKELGEEIDREILKDLTNAAQQAQEEDEGDDEDAAGIEKWEEPTTRVGRPFSPRQPMNRPVGMIFWLEYQKNHNDEDG